MLAIGALLAANATPGRARAFCNGGQTWDGFTVFGQDASTGYFAACNWNYTTNVVSYAAWSGCNSSTPATDQFKLTDSGTYANESQVAPVVEAGGIWCKPDGGSWHHINPWPASFHFGMFFTGYSAKVFVYGTPNADYLYSFNYSYGSGNDHQNDVLCGYSGNDTLYGDLSDSTAQEECLNGGAGSDYCNGDDNTLYDTSYSCETSVNVRSSGSADCACGTSPPAIWSSICGWLTSKCTPWG